MPQKYKQDLHENDIRLRYLYLYRILEQCTDEEHPKTTNELRAIMEEQYGIHLHRTTVYNDMELLKMAGVPVRHIRKRNNQYYLAKRQFELPELKLLIDAVESTRFLTEEQSRMLVDKRITLTSETNADKLKRNLHVTGRDKAENRKLFEIIDTINEAKKKEKQSPE